MSSRAQRRECSHRSQTQTAALSSSAWVPAAFCPAPPTPSTPGTRWGLRPECRWGVFWAGCVEPPTGGHHGRPSPSWARGLSSRPASVPVVVS